LEINIMSMITLTRGEDPHSLKRLVQEKREQWLFQLEALIVIVPLPPKPQ